jgi:hypothetical protein
MRTPAILPFARSLVILSCTFALAGCGYDDGLGTRYTITGKVTYKGRPVKKAMIYFAPDATGLSACGPVMNGVYESLTTRHSDDGILPGKYHVAIFPYPDQTKASAPAPAPKEGDVKPAESPACAVERVYTSNGQPLPDKYHDLSRSGLQIEVTSNTFAFDFELND